MLIEIRKRIRTAAEIDLPEPIIQLIQSFLTTRESARTTILSKSWRSAWLTSPDLIFSQANFCGVRTKYINREFNPKFLEFVEKTLERYETSNLNIHSFNLIMSHPKSMATKLICRALKLGPTRLTLDFVNSDDFLIPNEVFSNENLLSLTAQSCRINPNPDEVSCSSLQSLSFYHVQIESYDTIFCIISRFPLIEKLSLEKVYVDRDYRAASVVDDSLLTNISPLHRLKTLVLKHVNFDTLFLADLSSKLPSLKDLTLHIIDDREKILISSPTLERLDFQIKEQCVPSYTTMVVQVVKLDVPSIRKLTFACSDILDEMSVIPNSRGWESCVSLTRAKCSDASWFYKLSNFIDKFKFSRISLLSLHVYVISILIHEEAGDIRGLFKPEIENLTIYDPLYTTNKSYYTLFDRLFQMCHPKVINIRYVLTTYRTNIIKFLVKRFLDAQDAKVSTPNQYYLMWGLNEYIKEARAQVFDRAVSTWRDVTLNSLADEDSTIVENYRDFRFHLNWKE